MGFTHQKRNYDFRHLMGKAHPTLYIKTFDELYYLSQLDLDIEQLKKDMNNPEMAQIIKQDIEDGKKLGVRKTPTFFINRKPLKSFGYEQLQNAIEAEL